MRQLVHQQQAGAAGERGIQVELLQGATTIRHGAARQDGECADLRLGFRSAMAFHDADQDVGTLGPAARAAAFSMSQVLPTPGRGAEEQFQVAFALPRCGDQQGFRVGADGVIDWHAGIYVAIPMLRHLFPGARAGSSLPRSGRGRRAQ